jgi:hypothetical protein
MNHDQFITPAKRLPPHRPGNGQATTLLKSLLLKACFALGELLLLIGGDDLSELYKQSESLPAFLPADSEREHST